MESVIVINYYLSIISSSLFSTHISLYYISSLMCISNAMRVSFSSSVHIYVAISSAIILLSLFVHISKPSDIVFPISTNHSTVFVPYERRGIELQKLLFYLFWVAVAIFPRAFINNHPTGLIIINMIK